MWIGILITFLLLGLGGIVGWRYLKADLASPHSELKPVIARQIPKVVQQWSDSLYHISYTSLDIDPEGGCALITGLRITPDSGIFRKMVSERRAPNNLISFSASKITVSRFTRKGEGKGRAWHIGDIQVTDPSLHITNRLRSWNDTVTEKKGGSLFVRVVRHLLRKIDIDDIGRLDISRIGIDNGSVVFVNENEKARRTTAMRKLHMYVSGLSTEPGKGKDSGSLAVCRIAHYRLAMPDGLYFADLEGIAITPDAGKVLVAKAAVIPRVSIPRFYKVVARANDRYRMLFTGISMDGIDGQRLARRQQLHVRNITVDRAWVEIYTDYNWPLHTPPPRRNAYPHDRLQEIAYDVTVDTARLKEGDIYYRIVAEKSRQEAVLSMRHTASIMTHITNNIAAKRENPFAAARMSTLMMGAGRMDALFRFNLADKAAAYHLSATMGPSDGRVLNPLIMPLSMIEIKAASLKGMKQEMDADEYGARGNIDFYYSGMKVRMLKREEEDTTLRRMHLLSFLTNLALPDANPRRGGKFSKGPINVRRDPRESFFGFLWRATLDGMSSAVMGTNQKKSEPRNIVTRIGKIIAGPKKGEEEQSTGKDKLRPAHRIKRK